MSAALRMIPAVPMLRAEVRLTAAQLAAAAGLSPRVLARMVRLGLIEPSAPGAADFTAEAAARLRRMCRLHADLGVGLVGAGVIVDLVDRLDRLEAELARVRADPSTTTSNQETR
jgi:chaperone modulatory protein CbpM